MVANVYCKIISLCDDVDRERNRTGNKFVFVFNWSSTFLLPIGVSGYVSSNFYRNIGGTNWVWNVVLTTSLFSGEAVNCSGENLNYKSRLTCTLHLLSNTYFLFCPQSCMMAIFDMAWPLAL